MTPQIALDLSLDGITVLSRAPDGGWWREGRVLLDLEDMPARLADMRDRAAQRVGEDFTSILILPDSQLLYTSLERDDRRPDETIRALLKGRTPYQVEDLTFDYMLRGDRLQVAVVALETLLEAETFAADYGFRPVAIVANPQDPAYPGIPSFGRTGIADEFIGKAALDLQLEDGFSISQAPPLPAPPQLEVLSSDASDAADGSGDEASSHGGETAPTEEASSADTAPKAPAGQAPSTDDPAAAQSAEDPQLPRFSRTSRTAPEAAPSEAVPPRPESTGNRGAAPEASAAPLPPQNQSPEGTVAEGSAPSVSFASRRKAEVGAPTLPKSSGERLARVTPRLTPPPTPKRAEVAPTDAPSPQVATKDTPQSKANGPGRKKPKAPRVPPPFTATPRPPETPAPRVTTSDVSAQADVLDGAPQTTPPAIPKVGTEKRLVGSAKAAAGRLGAITERIKARQAAARAAAAPTPEDLERQAEAKALALPGLARDQVDAPKRSSARLGLTLTLGLLGTLVLVGLGSVLLGPGSDTQEAASTAPVTLPEQDSAAEAQSASAAAVPETPPQADDDADIELALLLPEAGETTATGAVQPGIVSPPTPLPSQAEAISDAPTTTLSEDQLLPEIAPDLAAAPELDAAPAADTVPAVFTEAFEAEGIFSAPAPFAAPAAVASPDKVRFAAIDPSVNKGDAVLLPAALPPTDTPRTQINPPPAEQASDRDAALGLVTATPEGTVAPGGYTVILGRPVVVPTPRGGTAEAQAADDPLGAADEEPSDSAEISEGTEPASLSAEEREAQEILRRTRPLPRPADAAERLERAANNGLTFAELRRLRPEQRPASVLAAAASAAAAIAAAQEDSAAISAAQQAAAASLASAQTDEAFAAAVEANRTPVADDGPISELALRASDRPRTRPRSVEREAARIVTARRERATSAAESASASTAATPPARSADSGSQTIRSAGGNVARAATERNVLRLNRINLIGVYGRPNARRALVRLANGRYVKVEVGDRLDRGRVTAIGEGELSYQRGGRNVVLRMPRA